MIEFPRFSRRHWVALAAFIVSALAMGLVWQLITKRIDQDQLDQFDFDTQLITTRIDERMAGSVHMLRGAAGLFSASGGNVTREAWRRYVWELNLDQTTPRGVQLIGYAKHIPGDELNSYVKNVRQEGYGDFTVNPAGHRSEYSSIHFLEPFAGDNLRMFGFDMLTDPVRGGAMLAARDSASPVFSGKIRFDEDGDSTNEQAGVVVFYPVYSGSALPQTPELRRAALTGWVYLSFRMNDLMEALLSRQLQSIRLEVFDGDNLEAEHLLFDSLPVAARALHDKRLERVRRLNLDGRAWTLRYSALPSYSSTARFDAAWAILGAMVAICVLLFGMTWGFMNTQEYAQKIASRLTASLRSSEARYRAIFTRSGLAALLVDPNSGRIVEANEAAVMYYGVAAVDLLDMPLSELVMAEPAALTSVLEDAKTSRLEHIFQQHRLRNGTVRQVEVHIGSLDLDGRRLLYCVVHDITERREAENAVLDLNRRYQGLLDAASEVAIIATDTQGLTTVFNRGAERMLGYVSGDVVGRMAPTAFHEPHELQRRSRELTEALGYEVAGFKTFVELPLINGSEQREWTYVRKDSTLCRVSLSVTPVRTVDSTVVGYLLIAIDISRLKEAEASLLQAKEAAEQASQAKSTFLATMSHEIRTPMNGVIGMAQLLQASDLSREQQEYAEIIMVSAESLLSIINDILDFSKVEAGKLTLEAEPFALRPLLASVAGIFLPQVRERGLAMETRIAPGVPEWVIGDAVRFRQVLINLLGNAVKFTKKGGVDLEVAVVEQVQRGVKLELVVRDSGVGMSPQVVEGLFAPFYQGDSSISRRFGGTGLGLSITRGLVDLMAGDISVESTEGVGSSFRVLLPLSLPEYLPQGDPAAILQSLPAKGHILVVDDTTTNQKVALQMLNKLGLSGVAVGNGEEALRMLGRGKFDLVLMDCQMPVMDGFKATEKIRAGDAGAEYAAIPVIAMTANAVAGDRERCLAVGMNDYLPKPVVLAKLRAMLQQWLPGDARPVSEGMPPPPPLRETALPVFDERELLRNCGHDVELAYAVVDAALPEVASYIDLLDQVLHLADPDATRHQAHALKGLAAQLSGKRLTSVVRHLEAEARVGIVPPAAVMTEVREEYAELLAALETFRRGPGR